MHVDAVATIGAATGMALYLSSVVSAWAQDLSAADMHTMAQLVEKGGVPGVILSVVLVTWKLSGAARSGRSTAKKAVDLIDRAGASLDGIDRLVARLDREAASRDAAPTVQPAASIEAQP